MKRTLVLATALLLSIAAGAEARVHLSLFGGYATTPDNGAGEGGLVGCGLGFSLSQTFTLEITASRTVVPTKSSGSGLSRGNLTEIPIELELRALFPLGRGKFGAYVSGGMGYAFHSFALDETVASGWDKAGLNLTENVDHGFAAHLGLGLEIPLGPAVALDLGARYTLLRTTGSWAMSDLASGENSGGNLNGLNFDALAIIAGFRVAFR